MQYKYVHTAYCRKISDLTEALEKLKPEQVITVTQGNGYTVIYKSNNQYSFQDGI